MAMNFEVGTRVKGAFTGTIIAASPTGRWIKMSTEPGGQIWELSAAEETSDIKLSTISPPPVWAVGMLVPFAEVLNVLPFRATVSLGNGSDQVATRGSNLDEWYKPGIKEPFSASLIWTPETRIIFIPSPAVNRPVS